VIVLNSLLARISRLKGESVKSRQSAPDSSVDWLALVVKVKGGDPQGRNELHRLFSGGIRFFLSRQLGLMKLQARVQETFMILLSAIKTGDLHEHEPLVRLVRAIVLKQVAAYSHHDVQKRSQPGVESPGVILDDSRHPGENGIHLLKKDRMVAVLKSMSLRNQEALTRFYCQEQTPERICEEMQLSKTQFLLLKARAKAGFEGTGMASLATVLM
jgi:DNA-directed RNA polymerase specialized sigma24 family protein